VADTEGHRGGLGFHVELAEEAGQVRVSDLVVNHETGVDGDGVAVFVDGDRIGVAAGIIVLLEERQIVTGMQKVRASQAGDPCADDSQCGHAAARWEGCVAAGS
jgi:hypothetical protein